MAQKFTDAQLAAFAATKRKRLIARANLYERQAAALRHQAEHLAKATEAEGGAEKKAKK